MSMAAITHLLPKQPNLKLLLFNCFFFLSLKEEIFVKPGFRLDCKDTTSSLQSTLSKKTNQIASAFHSFSTMFFYTWAGNMSVYSIKSMFWTNEKLSLMVAWSSSVSISCFKVQSSIGHLVWFFDSGNSIVYGANLWCPCISNGLYSLNNCPVPFNKGF